VGQLPRRAGDRWTALPFADGARPPGGVVQIVAQRAGAPRLNGPVAGLFVDEWVEVIPSDSEVTGVALRFDEPGARAPQAVLLALGAADRGGWDLASLEALLLDTLELAKLRAIDPQVLTQVGQFLPATMLALDGDQTATSDPTPLLAPA
jgi:hypothetical protein